MDQRHVGQRGHEPHHGLRAVGRQLAVPAGVGDASFGSTRNGSFRRRPWSSRAGRTCSQRPSSAAPIARRSPVGLFATTSAAGRRWVTNGGNFVEVPTDANGRASVEVSPNGGSGGSGGSTTVNITINRPPQARPNRRRAWRSAAACALITWGSAAAPMPSAAPAPARVPAPSLPAAPGVPNYPFTPSGATPTPATSVPPLEPTPRATSPGDSYSPPPSETAGRPLLDVTLRRLGTEAIAVGDYVSFEVTVTNKGDGTARKIEVRDRFDRGLTHPSAKPGEFSVEYLGMRDLAPGESAKLPSPLTFQVVAAGQQCHDVTVSAEGVTPVTQTRVHQHATVDDRGLGHG